MTTQQVNILPGRGCFPFPGRRKFAFTATLLLIGMVVVLLVLALVRSMETPEIGPQVN
jgi:hypothetical protein